MDLQKAVDVSRHDEVTKQQLKNLQNKHADLVEKKQKQKPTPSKQQLYEEVKKDRNKEEKMFKCRRCNRTHGYRNCQAFGKVCSKCKKQNHFSICCKGNIVKKVKENVICFEVDDVKTLDAVDKKWLQNVSVEGKNITFKLDTGAEVNILPHVC